MSVRPNRKISLRELDENFNESDIDDLIMIETLA